MGRFGTSLVPSAHASAMVRAHVGADLLQETEEMMAQQEIVRGVKTAIFQNNGDTVVNYRGTDVVRFNTERTILDSNGWRTNTTKTRMNQASNQFGLGYRVFQKDFAWYVDVFEGSTARYDEPYKTIDFHDGMVI